MNRERARALADFIAREPPGTFQMECCFGLKDDPACGTAPCLAGSAAVLSGALQAGANRRRGRGAPYEIRLDPWLKPAPAALPVFERARGWLGLTEAQAKRLLKPNGADAFHKAPPGSPRHVSRRRAIRQLRRLAATGEVDWSATP